MLQGGFFLRCLLPFASFAAQSFFALLSVAPDRLFVNAARKTNVAFGAACFYFCKNNKITSDEEKTHGRSIKLYWTDAYF